MHTIATLHQLNQSRWSEDRIRTWYAGLPWLVGANYLPASAINQLEMWQAETWNPGEIRREFALARGLGMNTMRVFLHDLLWQHDREGFPARLDQFLGLAQEFGIRPLLVIFDSCWHPFPRWGRQPQPEPGVHNSGWLQSPGAHALQNPEEWPRLEAYVRELIGAFAEDARILGWDLWNEPDNMNRGSYQLREPENKPDRVLALLPKLFAAARAAKPSQPLTSGIWYGDWTSHDTLPVFAQMQIELSDFVSFHQYGDAASFRRCATQLQRYRRPLVCTEYMARTSGSTFEAILPIMQELHIAAFNWGFVAGKSQTQFPWDSWRLRYGPEPELWHHDLFRPDHTPYRAAETDFLRAITARA